MDNTVTLDVPELKQSLYFMLQKKKEKIHNKILNKALGSYIATKV